MPDRSPMPVRSPMTGRSPRPCSTRLALLAPALLVPALLAGCTGTTEDLPVIRLALLTDGGQTLRTLTPGPENAASTDDASVTVADGVSVDVLAEPTHYALTLRAGIEARTAPPGPPPAGQAFTAPGFTPCFTNVALSAGRDRVLALSDCPNDVQRLALYRTDGSLIWTARLPVFLPPTGQDDAPPVRLAVLTGPGTDVGLVARPVIGGGSELLRVAPLQTGNAVAEVRNVPNTVAIRDLAPFGAGIVAATDSGLYPLKDPVRDSGEIDTGAALKAFGTQRYDRVWNVPAGGTTLLAAWRSNVAARTTSEPLRLWDGRLTEAATVATVADLRDVTVDPVGFLYALTGTALTRYDTTSGLALNTWKARVLLSGLQDARSVTWVLP